MTKTLQNNSQNIRDNKTIIQLLDKMPTDVANSFNDEQLTHLMTAIGARNWGRHRIDKRGTFKIPFYKWRFYYVILFGKNHRELSRNEQQLSLLTLAIMTTLLISFSTFIGLIILYLIKSALGIDLFPNFSLGLWSWFKSLF